MIRGKQQKQTDTVLLQLLRKNRLQILTLDEHWHRLFTEEDKSERLKKLEYEVNTCLKKRGRVNTDLKEIKNVKHRLMKNIMDNMEGVAGEEERIREKRLDKSQKLIHEANEKIAQLELAVDEMPAQLEEANRELLEESVKLCYNRIYQNRDEIEELSAWIEETKAELKKRLVIKQELEDENAMIYSNLHDMLGRELAEYFDSRYGEDGEAG